MILGAQVMAVCGFGSNAGFGAGIGSDWANMKGKSVVGRLEIVGGSVNATNTGNGGQGAGIGAGSGTSGNSVVGTGAADQYGQSSVSFLRIEMANVIAKGVYGGGIGSGYAYRWPSNVGLIEIINPMVVAASEAGATIGSRYQDTRRELHPSRRERDGFGPASLGTHYPKLGSG